MADIKFSIVKSYGAISVNLRSGWRKEVNLVSWNEGNPKIDIREWNPEHTMMGKGITLSEEELRELIKILPNTLPEKM